ncbi:hypothetical protein NDU88_002160 [Pleurodeles waltl]|uniref:Uncharacterized protein n=1 Tax=Pleurodeles waltl TaxID=8319 RepID=A0AAV7TKD8_PLEWA|nr:hypothetical protein NDU88_002160 [Pleurodeles waltl]
MMRLAGLASHCGCAYKTPKNPQSEYWPTFRHLVIVCSVEIVSTPLCSDLEGHNITEKKQQFEDGRFGL